MAEYKGLTIRIGGDTSSLQNALKAATKAAAATQREITQVNRAMRFDPAGVMNVETKMRLLDNRAESVASRMRTLNTSISEMSQRTVRFDGAATELGDLAESTGNAQLAASRAQKEYADLVETIARTYLGIENVANASDEFGAVWSRFSPEKFKMSDAFARLGDAEFAEVEDALRRIGAVTDDDMERISALRSEFHRLSENNEAAGLVAQLEQAKVQSQLCEAEARDLAAAYARLSTPTLVSGLEEARGEMRLLESQAEQLKADLSSASELRGLDPTNLATAQRYMRDLRDLSVNAAEQVRVLRTQLDSFRAAGIDEASEGVGDLARESERAEQAVRDVSVRLNSARDALYNARREMQSVDGDTDEARAAVARLEDQVESLEGEFRQASEASARLTDVGEYRSLSQQLRQAEDAAEGYATQMRNATQRSNGFWNSVREVGYGISGSYTQAVVELGRYAIQSGDDIDLAYRDMRKTVQGTESDFEALKQSAIEFSETNVTGADQVLAIQAIGGELGIATDALDTFAETVSNLSIATNLDVDTAATSLGTLSNILDDLDEDHMPNFADALVRLGNNGASTETQIADIAQRIGSMGSIVGMTTPEILAWASTIASTGQGAESAGTAINNTIMDIEQAVANGTDKLDLFAETAGMSAEQFKAAWADEPSDVLKAFVEGLVDLEEHGGSATERLNELDISNVRQIRAIEGLMQSIGGLDANLMMSENAWNGVSDVWGQAGDAANEASKKAEGLSGSVSIFNNVAQAFAAEAGEAMVPAIHLATDALKMLNDAFSSLPDWAQTAVVGLMGISAAAGPVLVGVSNVKNAIDVLRGTTDVMNLTKAIREMGGLGKATETAGDAMKTAGTAISGGFSLIEGGASAAASSQGLLAGAAGTVKTAVGGVLTVTNPAVVALGALAAMGGTVAWALGQEAEKAEEAAERSERLAGASRSTAELLEAAGQSARQSGEDASEGADGYDELLASMEEFDQKVIDTKVKLDTDEASVDSSLETISRLAGNTAGDPYAQQLLAQAVSEYNRVTGSNVSVIDEETGALSESTQALYDNAEAWKHNATTKAYESLAAEALQQEVQAQRDLADAQAEMEQAQADMNKYRNDTTQEGIAAYQEAEDRYQKAKQEVQDYEEALESATRQTEELNMVTSLVDMGFDDVDAGRIASAVEDLDGLGAALADQSNLEAFRAAYDGTLTSVIGLLDQWGVEVDEAQGASARAAASISQSITGMGEQVTGALSDAGFNANQLAEAMNNAGLTAEDLSAIPPETLASWIAQADSIEDVIAQIQAYNGTDAEDKDASVSVDTVELTSAEGDVYVWNGTQLLNKDGSVSMDTVQLVTAQGAVYTWNGTELLDQDGNAVVDTSSLDIAQVKKVTYNNTDLDDDSASATVSGNVPEYTDYIRTFNNTALNPKSTTVTVAYRAANLGMSIGSHFSKRARGGIRTHADGAYIARSATMISPWDVVGEDGAEAIVPLTNRRYSRPFAEQVAEQTGLGEMMGALVAEVSALRSDVQAIDPNLYVDGRQLARATASEYDRALYRQQSRRRL